MFDGAPLTPAAGVPGRSGSGSTGGSAGHGHSSGTRGATEVEQLALLAPLQAYKFQRFD
jgi:hypothetical protein